MLKAINFIKCFVIINVLFSLCFLVYGFYSFPDEIYTVSDEKLQMKTIYSLQPSASKHSSDTKSVSKEGKYEMDVKLFNAIPVKKMNMTVGKRKYVVPCGTIFGLRLFTNGVVIVSTGTVETENGSISPAESVGLLPGDAITEINGKQIKTCNELIEIFGTYSGVPFELKYMRNNKVYSCLFSLYYSVNEQKYMAGLWVKDSAAGIGTMTFYDKNTSLFGGLGHGVYDAQSNKILPLYNGDIVNATVNGCYKGKYGQPGELCGVFTSDSCGVININSPTGVYGFLSQCDKNKKEIPVALRDEVKEGQAQIISTVDSGEEKYYTVEIEKVNKSDDQNRNLVLRVTDEELLNKTGGIVQGMSGSPIIQNGMLIGAVTHVFVNDPIHGYGIFAAQMLESAETLIDESFEKAS